LCSFLLGMSPTAPEFALGADGMMTVVQLDGGREQCTPEDIRDCERCGRVFLVPFDFYTIWLVSCLLVGSLGLIRVCVAESVFKVLYSGIWFAVVYSMLSKRVYE